MRLAPKTFAVSVAAAMALIGGVLPYAVNAWPRLEKDTLDARFAVRGAARPPSDVVIVAIDEPTFNYLRSTPGMHSQWPFPRRYEARVINALHRAGARVIAIDIQFTEPTDPYDDNALYGAVSRAGHVVLATTVVNAAGQTDVLGGQSNLRAADAVAATANLPADAGGVIRRYPYLMLGIKSFAVATAQAAGKPISPSRFQHDTALIDFRGPPGTIQTTSFSEVLRDRVNPRTFRDKIVVVGATAPTLQDLHPTSTTSTTPMAGVEVQTNAIWSALHDNPLASAPSWVALSAILLLALMAPLASLRFRVLISTLIATGMAGAYLLLAQVAFDSGTVIAVSYPIAAYGLGTVGMLAANYVAASAERNAFSHQLHESQRELIQRLAQSVESRDAETGEHTYRIGVLCQHLAVQIGWSQTQAQTLMYASVAHDIGKIGIPDSILLKPGPLDDAEWQIMKTHTTIGAQLLARSANPLVQMAETIALTHHERWDGNGYPAGLKGEEIPLVGRICAVVDVYDALLSKRPYKDAWRIDDVLAEIQQDSGTKFDPKLVSAFMRLAPRLTDELQASLTREKTSLAPHRAMA
ncbi:MAG: CHASE2 domain-containing protein [Solirubrobacteraceae bacterium]